MKTVVGSLWTCPHVLSSHIIEVISDTECRFHSAKEWPNRSPVGGSIGSRHANCAGNISSGWWIPFRPELQLPEGL